MKSELLARTEAEALNCDVWQAAGDSTSDYLPHATGWPKQNIYYIWQTSILYARYAAIYLPHLGAFLVWAPPSVARRVSYFWVEHLYKEGSVGVGYLKAEGSWQGRGVRATRLLLWSASPATWLKVEAN